ncbi:Protein of unknown function [Colwellia chukchiensis]|uniref:DUF2878 domain-containing protein n=1 Tax=Colwellia chukchiensis TaxID=641665 RepID=A0A1H7SVP1_9GAMM|nr:DUF2878 domain-containing protein [Colwellia chukchiensis]SEL76663.1 Protein of unknown function [Colwellia chukchiensis]
MVTKSKLWNLICFNLAWFGLVFIGNLFIPIAILLLGLQLFVSRVQKSEWLLIFIIASMGILMDLGLVYSGMFIFPNTHYLPYWLIVLWFCFASTIRQSLAFLAKSVGLQFMVAALFAPLSYLVGAKAGVVTFGPSLATSYLILSALWGPMMVAFFALSRGLQSVELGNAS